MATLISFRQLNHRQRVLKLYKAILKNLESWYYHRPVFRYQATIIRACFDENKSVPPDEAANLLLEAEKKLAKKSHYQIKQFPKTIGGSAYGRDIFSPDWVLDYWHPLEKAQYPHYFKRREQRKCEYIEMWEVQYGPSNSSDSSR